MTANRLFRLAMFCLLVGGIGLASATPAAAERYVAMGDSYSAGTGTDNYNWTSDGACQRSTQAYGPLIRGALGASSSFRFAACSGAVINQVTTNTQSGNPGPQVSMLGADTRDVTITIGGNDAGFGDVLLQCGYPMVSCDGDIDTAQAFITNTLPGKLDQAYDLIRQRAPNARVAVVSYPRLFPADGEDCSAATFFSAGEISRLNQTADMLADVTRARARARGFAFVDARPAFLGHAWCEAEWINGLSNPTNNSYHPNVDGYQGFAGIVRGAMLATPDPAFVRGPNGRIAFSSSRDGNSEIYTINGNGSFPVNLTGNAGQDQAPSFSPDGERIVFASDRTGNFEIYTMASTGGTLTRLTNNPGSDFDPSFSPNGRQIVFRSDRDGDNEIYKINADGTPLYDAATIHKLTDNTASDFLPSYSPDGAEIVFQRQSAAAGNEVFKMNADGQGQLNLTANAATVNDGGPRFSPDGSQIAFHSNRAGNFEIYTMGATGGTATRRTTNTSSDRNPEWAPNGSQIAFQSDRDGTEQVYTMAATGSAQVRRTTGAASETSPTWQGDARPPVTAIVTGPPAASNRETAEFTFDSDELGSSFECRIDSGAFAACVSPFASEPLPDGAHSFAVRAKDPSGNVDPGPAAFEFSIDTSAKVTQITSGPSGPTASPAPVFEFESEDEAVTFDCRLDGATTGVWAPCASPHSLGTLADGEYTLTVRGTDGVGNVEPEPPARHFTVDTAGPESAITLAPPATSSETAPFFEFAAGAGDADTTFECRLDPASGGEWEPCESPRQLDALGDGAHRFEVRGTDRAGNVETEAAGFDFTVDTTAPSANIAAAPGPAEPAADVSFSFASEDPTARFECRLDDLDDSDWTSCASPREYDDLHHGQHTFQVRAIDQVGNAQAEPTTVDFGVRTSPEIRIAAAPADPSGDATPAFEFDSTDPGAEFECRLDGDAAAAWEPCASPFRIGAGADLADGVHRFELRGTDSFGELFVVAPHEWTLVTTAPVAEILSGPPELANSRVATFEIDAGPVVSVLQCRLDGSPWAECHPGSGGERLQTVSYTGLNDGEHDFRVRSVGELHGTGPEARRVWSIDTTAPRASIDSGPPRFSRQASASITFSSPEPDARFACRMSGGSSPGEFTPCVSPLKVDGLADGDHRVEVSAIDIAGNTGPAAVRAWTVDTAGPLVELTEAPADGTTTSARFAFSANEAGSSFDCRLDQADWRACNSPTTVGPFSIGNHGFEVRATDSLGNQGPAVAHNWTVSAPDVVRPPAIRFKAKARLKPRGSIAVATVVCGGSDCRISAPSRVALKIGSRRFEVRLRTPGRIASGRRADVTVALSPGARSAIGGRGARLKLRLAVVAGDGQRVARTGSVSLRR